MRQITLLDGQITLTLYGYHDCSENILERAKRVFRLPSKSSKAYAFAMGKIEWGVVGDTLHENCPYCGSPTCNFDCDQSQSDDLVEEGQATESEEEVCARIQFNSAIDGITALVLAQACVGIDVEAAQYQETLQTCLDAVGNYYS